MAIELSESLRRAGLSVALDDRQDSLLGEKFRFADFYNVPVRLVLGDKEVSEGVVELRRLDDSGRYKIPVEEIPNVIHA
jgi:prolyl-tRNA synthetase